MNRFAAVSSLIGVLSVPVAAQRATGVAPGIDTTTASLIVALQPQQIIQQQLAVRVVFGPPLAVQMWKGVRLVAGQRIGIPIDSVLVGESGCIYVTATNQFGAQIAGLGPIHFSSNNPAVLNVDTINAGGVCPVRTVTFADMPVRP